MNRFVIVDGLPYLAASGKTYAVRWNKKGFTVGAEVELASVPETTYSELEIMAQCAGHLDSISGAKSKAGQKEDDQKEDEKKADDTP